MSRFTSLFTVTPPQVKRYQLGAISFRMISLPERADFAMGNNEGEEEIWSWEQPQHQRQIHAFALGEYPVSQALWQAVYEAAEQQRLDFDRNLLGPAPAYFPGPQRPVERVSWDDAQEFCRVLNALLGQKQYFRLPSEAEWEYAARAGSRERLYAGSNVLAEVGWYADNNYEETLPSGMLAPNAFGLYDMSGNVWEWCEDGWYGNYHEHPPDSRAWVDADKRSGFRVLRGGSWSHSPRGCRSAYRYCDWPGGRIQYFGFRLAASVPGS
ncbi:MAG: formylglycine-generating enzyme family protein [Bacteroidota bacterium]